MSDSPFLRLLDNEFLINIHRACEEKLLEHQNISLNVKKQYYHNCIQKGFSLLDGKKWEDIEIDNKEQKTTDIAPAI